MDCGQLLPMGTNQTSDHLDAYLKRIAELPDDQFYRLVDNPRSALWRVIGASRERLVQLYWYRRQAGLWRRPPPKKSPGRFALMTIALLDEAIGEPFAEAAA